MIVLRTLAIAVAVIAWFAALFVVASPGNSWAATTFSCTRVAENPGVGGTIVIGSCTPTGTYSGTGGDAIGSVATGAASAAVLCGSAQRTLKAVIAGTGADDAGTAAVAFRFDLANWKVQAFTAAGSPGLSTALAEGNSSLTLTDLTFSFVALCQ